VKEKKRGPKPASKRGDYWQKYYAENREREAIRKREWYLANRDDVIARNQKNQRAAASTPPTYRVGIKRRYLLAGGRAYFNSALGYSAKELRAIAKELAASLAA
jgi:hypothetical protein